MAKIKSSTVDINNLLANEQIIKSSITDEIEKAMMTYAIKTITDRALPDVRDGLKPVQRRILYGSYKNGYYPYKKFVKNARIVGDVMGQYHPHGDCHSGDTKFYLANGEIKTIKELYENGDDVEIYAIDDKTGKPKHAIAHSFRIGQYTNKKYHLKLSNGEEICCTNNHPFLTNQLKWIKAENIKKGQRLYFSLIKNANNYPYMNIPYIDYNESLHYITYLTYNDEIENGYLLHHKDENTKNNTINNLEYLLKEDHDKLHQNYLNGLYKGHETMKNDPIIKKKIKQKNSYLISQYNKNQGLYKAIKIIKDLKDKDLDINVNNYNKLRNSEHYYNYPKIDNMIERNQIKSFEDLVQLADNTNQYIKFDKNHAYNKKILEYIEENQNEEDDKTHNKRDTRFLHFARINFLFNCMIELDIELTPSNYEEFRINYCKNQKKKHNVYKRNFPKLSTIQQKYGFNNLVNNFNKECIRVIDIEIEKVDNEPMYDFTVDNYENALIVTKQEDNILYLVPTHNSSIYGALAAMSQPWNYRYPLMDFQGNQGSLDGDDPAAMRYTEGKLLDISLTILDDVDKECVDFKPNYSEETIEPIVLPGLLPNLLLNGGSGIATGYTTMLPPHQMGEVIDAIIETIKTEDITLEDLMKHIKGPDFAGGGCLVKNEKIKELYKTGKAKLTFKAKYKLEDNNESNNSQIVFTELPPNVNKPKLVEKIYNLCVSNKTKKIPRVVDVRDESEGNGIRIVIELHKTGVPDIVLSELFDNTKLQQNITFKMRALVNQTPRILSLKKMINHYIDHRRDVVERRTKYILDQAQSKYHIQEGLKIVTSNIKKAVDIITNSEDDKDAIKKLIDEFNLTEIQSEQVLEIKLKKLTKLNKNDIKNLLDKLKSEIDEYESILSNNNVLDEVIIKELQELKEKYNDERRTTLINEEELDNINVSESDEPIALVLTNKNDIKHISLDALDKMFKAGRLKERTEYFLQGLKCKMSDTIILILEGGKYVKVEISDLVGNLNFLNKTSKIKGMVVHEKENENKVLVVMTKDGLIKKIKMNGFSARNKRIANLFEVEDGDEIVGIKVVEMDDNNIITISTKEGLVHRFFEGSFKETSAGGKGINGISLKYDDDEVIGFDITNKKDDKKSKLVLFTKHKNGDFGLKAMPLTEFKPKGRIAQGVVGVSFYKKLPGKVYSFVIVNDDFFVLDSRSNVHTFSFDILSDFNRYNKPETIDHDVNITRFFVD